MNQTKKWTFSTSLFAAIGLLAFSSCGFTNTKGISAGVNPSAPPSNGTVGTGIGTGGTPTSSAATYTEVSQQILQVSCVSCHSSGGQQPDLSSYAGFATSTQYVDPGNATSSLIYTITESGQMPQSGSPLTSAQLQLLASWIDAGAQND